MPIKVVQGVVKSIETDSDSIRFCGCSESSLAWWLLRPLGGNKVDVFVILDMAQVSISRPAVAVYCCGAICLTGPCWLLVIRRQMGCHDPSILPSRPLTQKAREVSVTHAITLPVVSIIPRKTQPRLSCFNTNTELNVNRASVQASCCMFFQG